MMLRSIVLSLSLLSLLGACATDRVPLGETRMPLPVLPQPEACGVRGAVSTPRLKLPPTEPPLRSASSYGPSADFAQVHTVNQALQNAGIWTDFEEGWSLLSLQLGSVGARNLAVRLREAKLPKRTEIWLCGSDGRSRQGPYREANGGELWTPVVPGSEAQLQVWLPTAYKPHFQALLADVYGGYR